MELADAIVPLVCIRLVGPGEGEAEGRRGQRERKESRRKVEKNYRIQIREWQNMELNAKTKTNNGVR